MSCTRPLEQKVRAQTQAHFIFCTDIITVMALPSLLNMLYVTYVHIRVGMAAVPPTTLQSFSAASTHHPQHQIPGQGQEAHNIPRAPLTSAWMDRTRGEDLCTGWGLNFGYTSAQSGWKAQAVRSPLPSFEHCIFFTL